jgi:hypothetical protein
MRQTLKTESEDSANATTAWDILMCDTMCMQCPGGRNILIQRQKSTLRGAISLGAGALTLGLGIPIVNQLAGCNKIGFEFWHNREPEDEQPLSLDADTFLGVFFPKSGLEKLEEEDKWNTHPDDVEAIEFCAKLTDPFLWQAVRGAFSSMSGHSQQQEFARRCLSHSALCGSDVKWELENGMEGSDLQVSRLNPLAGKGMCSPPKQDGDTVDDTHDGGAGKVSPGNGDAEEEDRTVPQEQDIVSDATLSADTVAAAGKLLGELTHATNDNKTASEDFFGLSSQGSSDDALVAQVAHQLCHSAEHYQDRCNKMGLQGEACKDRCCLDVCRFYSTKPSCVNTCVKS